MVDELIKRDNSQLMKYIEKNDSLYYFRLKQRNGGQVSLNEYLLNTSKNDQKDKKEEEEEPGLQQKTKNDMIVKEMVGGEKVIKLSDRWRMSRIGESGLGQTDHSLVKPAMQKTLV